MFTHWLATLQLFVMATIVSLSTVVSMLVLAYMVHSAILQTYVPIVVWLYIRAVIGIFALYTVTICITWWFKRPRRNRKPRQRGASYLWLKMSDRQRSVARQVFNGV